MYRLLLISFIISTSSWSQTPGNALSFDGINDYVAAAALPTVFSDIPNNDFTTEFWVSPAGSTTQRVMHAEQSSSNFTSILLNTSNTLYFYVYSGGTSYSIISDADLPSTWTHVACVWESGTQTQSMYINGVLQAGNTGGSSTTGTPNQFALGAKTDGSQLFDGELDEFRIWDVSRTACEIQGSMNSEFDSLYTDLVVYYNFNQGTAGGTNTPVTTLLDFSTNYDGTLTNFALTGGSSNWVASGATINALNQNNGNEFVALTDSICDGETLNFGGQTLVSTGVYYDTLTAQSGCDSIVEMDLEVIGIDNNVSVSGFTITSDQSGASYQWLLCDNGNMPISGQTNQAFTAGTNGNYAVVVTIGNCSDTSACTNISGVGIEDNNLSAYLNVYPNPTTGLLNISKNQQIKALNITVRSIDGKVVKQLFDNNEAIVSFDIEGDAGIYFVEINSAKEQAVFKIVKE